MAKDISAMVKDSSADIITPPEIKVVLPVGVDESAAVLQAAASAAEIHVLAVDDSTLDRKVIETLLKTSSYKVTSVDSGLKALDLLGIGVTPGPASININMIITDYCMPEMSGYDLLKRVKESSAFKEIPVVVMSSENVPTRIQRCLAEGAEEFIMKPVQLADVKRLKSHIRLPRLNLSEQSVAPCSSKRKYGSDGFQAQSPERRARLSGVTVA